jgi:uncharacterized protein YecE (DUF72 family)
LSVGRLRVGVSGWSYEDWRGIVYPRGCRDTLRAVARCVDFLEINTTFYRTPRREVVSGWVQRTDDLGTRFTAKLPQELTHGEADAAGCAASFAQAVEPLLDSDRLDALLAQFSFRLEAEASAFERLASIARAFAPFRTPLLVEVRHRSWRNAAAQARLVDLGLTPIHLDYADMAAGFAGPGADIAAHADAPVYLRCHGRNAEAWFDADAGRDATYDWLYSAGEIDSMTQRLDALAEASAGRTQMAAANNHFQGQAMVLALTLRARSLGQKVDVPDGLLARYPSLREIARHAQGGLF